MEKKKEYFTSTNQTFYYMMLDRLIQDVKYYLNYGHEKSMWAGSVAEQAKAMWECYNKIIEKPLWCTKEQLNEYIKQMFKKFYMTYK